MYFTYECQHFFCFLRTYICEIRIYNNENKDISIKKEKSTFAKNVVARRKALGWGADDLADNAKIGLQTVREIEAGISGGWQSTKEKIAKALGCTVEDLYLTEAAKPRTISELTLIIERQEKEIEELKSKLEGYNIISPKLLEWFQKNKDFANLMAEVADEHQPGLLASRLIKLSRGGTTGEDER